ncbi:MAG: ATP-binding protein [Hamadaea sp.]|nr:ATP-binding protein [Hamadaea sp.]
MSDPRAAHEAAVEEIWRLLAKGERTVVVDSPPGAGKSTLVRELTRRLVEDGARVPVVVQTNDQADDLVSGLVRELADAGSPVEVGRLHASGWEPPSWFPRRGLRTSAKLAELSGCRIVVATAAKWAFSPGETFELGIIDEAYQMSAAALVRIGDLFDRLLLVGDPGQLSPFTVADEHVVRSLSAWPLSTAAGVVLRHHPQTPVVPLPVSWRLAPHTAPVVSDAFYVRPFRAGVDPGVRRLELPSSAHPVLATAATHGWGLLELPRAYRPRTDPELVAHLVALARELCRGEARTTDERRARPLKSRDIAIGVAHTDQRDHVRAALDRAELRQITVDTANRLQGRQFEITLVWHPLSGRRDATAFHLETGRLCVLASRHRQACVVVTRSGVEAQLHEFPADEPVWLGSDPAPVDGWAANLTFLQHVKQFGGTA